MAAVSVSDGRGGVSRATAIVSVLSPLEAAWGLGSMVVRLASSTDGLKNLAGPLAVSARQAALKLMTGDTEAAAGDLGAFVNKLEAAVRSGRISQAAADPLIAYAQRILVVLGP